MPDHKDGRHAGVLHSVVAPPKLRLPAAGISVQHHLRQKGTVSCPIRLLLHWWRSVLQVTTERMIRELLAAETGEDMSPRKAVIREQASADYHHEPTEHAHLRRAMCWVQCQNGASAYYAAGCVCQRSPLARQPSTVHR